MVAPIIILSLLPVATVLAFTDTVPIVAWSSQKSDVLDVLPADFTSADSASLLHAIFVQSSICSYDAIVVIDQPGSDLRALHPTSTIVRLVEDAPSSRQLPHVKRGATHSVAELTESISSRCGSRLVNVKPGEGEFSVENSSKHVFCMNMPPIEGSLKHRKASMAGHESRLSSQLEKIAANFANHLVVYSGSPLELFRRADSSEFDSPPTMGSLGSTFLPGDNSTLPEGGIFKRYQLFSTPLIVALLVTFFLIVPIVLMGVTALASIQSPLSSDAPRGYNAQEKKVQ
ncbi:hypothetical protein BV22DRAFT_708789 [Leucogyrophana mollusca]|uniref:Uncharacterized protein n=1 Tax=Leucogyrophana mollusca TaxID=85980 RepID=A0ACB8B8U6_9AGAM|nr:hypothetical protein BV22DRAFT_708789 [Leucogyrophana mollusca]